MTETDKLYYGEMLKRDRLIPFFVRDKLICFISFYITNNPDKFIQRNNPWSVEEDEPETGKIAYIDQIWSDKKKYNHRYSFEVWKRLINFIKQNFPKVEEIYWHRWKNDIIKVFKKELKNVNKNFDFCKNECKAYCCNIITTLLKNNRTPQEENEVQLILAHEGTQLGEKDGVQYIEIKTRCKFLTQDNECLIYEKRFDTCRRYECEKLKKEMK